VGETTMGEKSPVLGSLRKKNYVFKRRMCKDGHAWGDHG